MPIKIQADMELNLKPKLDPAQIKQLLSNLKSVGFGTTGFGTIEEGIAKNPDLTRSILESYGVSYEPAKPPVIAGSKPPPLPSIKSGFLGQLAALENKFSGSTGLLGSFSRYEVGHSFLDSIGAGGGLGGRLGGVALAGFGGKLPGLTVAVAAATAAIQTMKLAIQTLIHAAEEGAKLYHQSRMIGASTARTALYKNVLRATGFDEGTALQLADYGQFVGHGGNGARMTGGNVAGDIQTAAVFAGMKHEIQGIHNLFEFIDQSSRDLAMASKVQSRAAKQNAQTIFQWEEFKIEFEAYWQGIAGLLGPAFEKILMLAVAIAEAANAFIGLALYIQNEIRKLPDALKIALSLIPGIGLLVPFGSPDKAPLHLALPRRDSHFSALEKIGLVIGGGHDKVVTLLQQIARNTGRMAGQVAGQVAVQAAKQIAAPAATPDDSGPPHFESGKYIYNMP